MLFVKKSDVKNHLSPHHHKGNDLSQPVIQPDTTGTNSTETARAVPNADHSLEVNPNTPAPVVNSTSNGAADSAISRGAQA